jgi:hypothetical protein
MSLRHIDFLTYRLQIVTMPSWIVVLDVVYPYIKVQVSIIGLMFPHKSSQWPLTLGWDQEGGEDGGYTFCKHAHQQITIDNC